MSKSLEDASDLMKSASAIFLGGEPNHFGLQTNIKTFFGDQLFKGGNFAFKKLCKNTSLDAKISCKLITEDGKKGFFYLLPGNVLKPHDFADTLVSKT